MVVSPGSVEGSRVSSIFIHNGWCHSGSLADYKRAKRMFGMGWICKGLLCGQSNRAQHYGNKWRIKTGAAFLRFSFLVCFVQYSHRALAFFFPHSIWFLCMTSVTNLSPLIWMVSFAARLSHLCAMICLQYFPVEVMLLNGSFHLGIIRITWWKKRLCKTSMSLSYFDGAQTWPKSPAPCV